MAKNSKKSGKGASKTTEQVSVDDLLKRYEKLEAELKAIKKTEDKPKAKKTSKAKKTEKAVEKPEETWKTSGQASESVEDALAYQKRISVQVQKSSEGREQVHIYSQVLIPKDKLRASTKGLDKQKATTSDGDKTDAYWINQRNPLIVRGDSKTATQLIADLIKTASK